MADAFGHNDFEDHRAQHIARKFEEKISKNEFFFIDLDQVNRIYDYYVDSQEWRKAMALLDFALQTYPTNSDLYFKRAYLCFEMFRFNLAEEAIEKALNLNPNTRDYLLLQADIQARLGRYEEAIESLQICLMYTDQEEYVYLQMGNVAQICQRNIDSERYYKEALIVNPRFEEAAIELIYFYESEEKPEAGILLAQDYLEENPYTYRVWFILGKLLQKLRRNREALDAYDYALVINEEYEEAYVKKGELLLEMERYQEALQSFLHANAYNPDKVHTLYFIGECYAQLESFRDAIKYYGIVSKLDPDYIDAWIGLGYCLERSEKYLEAIHYYQKAYKLDGESPTLCLAMAICEYKLGQRYNAYLYLEQALGLAPSDVSIWQDWAYVLYEHDNYVGAITYLEEGIKLNPDAVSLYYHCTAYCFEAGMKEKGLLYLENALLIDFHLHEVLFELIPELEQDPDIKEMIESYR